MYQTLSKNFDEKQKSHMLININRPNLTNHTPISIWKLCRRFIEVLKCEIKKKKKFIE